MLRPSGQLGAAPRHARDAAAAARTRRSSPGGRTRSPTTPPSDPLGRMAHPPDHRHDAVRAARSRRSATLAADARRRRHRPGVDARDPVARPHRGRRSTSRRTSRCTGRRRRARATHPSVDLLAGVARATRCAARSRSSGSRDAPAITQVRLERDVRRHRAGPARRQDGGRCAQPDQPEHRIALPIRQLRECLAEELRRLDAGRGLRRGAAEGPREDRRVTAALRPRPRDVVVHPDAGVLAEAVAARLLTRLVDVQSHRSPVHVVLTGGTVGIAALAAVAASPVRDAVDWSGRAPVVGRRAVPARRATRTATRPRPATALHRRARRRAAGRERAPDAARGRDDVRDARGVRRRATPTALRRGRLPARSTSCCSAWGRTGTSRPCSPATRRSACTGRPTVGVHGSPKPPPERVSLTFDAIRGAREVWVVAAGAEKAAGGRLRAARRPGDHDTGRRRDRHGADALAGRHRRHGGLGTPAALSTTAAAFPAPVDTAAELWTHVDDYFSVLVPEDVALVDTRHAAAAGGLPDIAVAANQGKLLHLLAQVGRCAADPRDRHARRLQHPLARPCAAVRRRA